jgi:ABC-type transport system involved in multi-copper enzyme maturation permease subunit
MKGLLKADFSRVLKDKLLLVTGILAVVFATSMPLLYTVLFSSVGMADDPMISSLISAKSQFFNAFSMGNNLGLIAPVLLAIALCKDFSYGTVRNKIIAGKSRSAIYLSLFVTCAAILTTIMLLYAFLTLGVSLLFFDYQAAPFTIADFWYFMESLVFEILVLLWMAALLTLLCAHMKNVGLAIVLYIAVAFLLVLVGSIVQMALTIMQTLGSHETTVDILHFINRINIGNAVQYIGTGTQYTGADVLYLTLPALAGILGFTGLGLWSFNKKDLK